MHWLKVESLSLSNSIRIADESCRETACEPLLLPQQSYSSLGLSVLQLATDYNVKFIPVHQPLCDANRCSMMLNNTILYRDNNHLNIPGNKLIGQHLSSSLFNTEELSSTNKN